MILSGKDLFNYRVNQIKKIAIGAASVLAMVGSMLLMCIIYG